MHLPQIPKAKRILTIGLSSVMLFLVILYWILSCTLLNPAFYSFVFESRAVQQSFTDASESINPEGAALFTGQALKENAYSLVEGFLRWIKKKDMSLSSIALEAESTQSMRSAVVAAAARETAELPDISRVHPFMVPYVLPGSEFIFTTLFAVQKAFSVLAVVIPILLFILVLFILLSEKPAENAKKVCNITGIALLCFGALLLFLRQPLLLAPLSGILSDSGAAAQIVGQATVYLFGFVVFTGGLPFLGALAVNLPPVSKMLNRFSRSLALVLILSAGLFLLLFHYEAFANTAKAIKTQAEQLQVKVLNREDGTVHSLTIKLREADTQAPVRDVKLTLVRMDIPAVTTSKISAVKDEDGLFSSVKPLEVTASSDAYGNARFILSEGTYWLRADSSTVPLGLRLFEPVMLTLDRPDSSWYTFLLEPAQISHFRRETPNEENPRLLRRPEPLLK